jgi:hypothetical protein
MHLEPPDHSDGLPAPVSGAPPESTRPEMMTRADFIAKSHARFVS